MEVAKRDGILSAAAKAFQRFGFKKASIDAIAEAAGVAKGTVYLAAQSKEDLFYQVLHREVRSWAASVAKNLDPRLPADELLAYASDAGVRYFDDHPLVRSLLFGECHLMLPKWKDRLDDLATIGRENVVDILRLGQKQGLFREDLDLDTVAVPIAEANGMVVRRAATVGTDARFVRMVLDLVDERRSAPPAAQRPALSSLGVWPDVCAADCCPAPARPAPGSGGPPGGGVRPRR